MRSHQYHFSISDLLRVVAAPALGLAMLSAFLHLGSWLRLLPPARPGTTPDETLLVFKSELSRARYPAEIVLAGDSSCAAGVDAPQLSNLLPAAPKVLNLGLIIGLGLDVYGEALADFLNTNPNRVRLVVLLVTPQLLTNQEINQQYRDWWNQLRTDVHTPGSAPATTLASLAGVPLLRERIMPWLLNVPLTGKGAALYGFSSGFRRYLTLHAGSMVDPGLFLPARRPGAAEVHLAPELEGPSRRFRQLVPTGTKLAVGLTPIPQSLAPSEDQRRRDQLLAQWNEWLNADVVLTNLPAQLADDLFASPTHLNEKGQRQFTQSLARALSGL